MTATAEVYIDPRVLWTRLLRRTVRADNGCWIFTGALTSRGYGCVGSGKSGRNITTHRLAVIVRDGSIPEGMTVDHQCHDSQACREGIQCTHRRCVNPAHLAVLTMGENVGRQYEAGLCRKGHGELEYRTRGNGKARFCRVCQYESQRRWTERQTLARAS